MSLRCVSGDQVVEIMVVPDGEALRVRLPDGSEHVVKATRLPGGVLELREERGGVERRWRVPVVRVGQRTEASWGGHAWRLEPATGPAAVAPARSSGLLVAPMVGVVASVHVAEGDGVAAGQALVVVEAMKVMATLEAPFAGRVTRVSAKAGQQVALGDVLVEVAPLEEGRP